MARGWVPLRYDASHRRGPVPGFGASGHHPSRQPCFLLPTCAPSLHHLCPQDPARSFVTHTTSSSRLVHPGFAQREQPATPHHVQPRHAMTSHPTLRLTTPVHDRPHRPRSTTPDHARPSPTTPHRATPHLASQPGSRCPSGPRDDDNDDHPCLAAYAECVRRQLVIALKNKHPLLEDLRTRHGRGREREKI